MRDYNEGDIVRRLADMHTDRQTAFAASIAQRLLGLYQRFQERTGMGDLAGLTAVLERVWAGIETGQGAVVDDQRTAESLVPDDSGEWVFEMGYAQNSAAAVAYAVRAQLTGDSQEAAWAARQIFEVADYAAQRQLEDNGQDEPTEAELAGHPLVQEALGFIEVDLARLSGGDGVAWSELPSQLESDSAAWLARMP